MKQTKEISSTKIKGQRWWLLLSFVGVVGAIVGFKFLLPDWVDRFLDDYFSWGVCFVIEAMVPFAVGFLMLLILRSRLDLTGAKYRLGVLKFRSSYIMLGVLLVLASQMLVSPIFEMFDQVDWLDGTDKILLTMQSGFFPMLVMIVLIPWLNQILFRGIIFSCLSRNFGVWWAILMVSALSSLSFVIPQMMVTGFAASFVYCAIYYFSGSMVSVVMINVIVNGISYLAFLMLGSEMYVREVIDSRVTLSVMLWTASAISMIILGWQISVRNSTPRKLKGKASK